MPDQNQIIVEAVIPSTLKMMGQRNNSNLKIPSVVFKREESLFKKRVYTIMIRVNHLSTVYCDPVINIDCVTDPLILCKTEGLVYADLVLI